MNRDFYPFDQFPCGELSFELTRRQLFNVFAVRMKAVAEEHRSGGAFNLSALGQCPDEQLAEMVPMVVPGCEISIHDDMVMAQPPDAAEPLPLFDLESPALVAFNHFNGQKFLEEAVADVEHHTGWKTERCFAYVRGLFLSLVLIGVCIPKYYMT